LTFVGLTRSGSKRAPASAGLGRVRIDKDETPLHQALLVVQGHAAQVNERFGVNEHAHTAELENAIVLLSVRLEPDAVTQPRAAASLHAQAQPALMRRNAFLDQSCPDSV